MWCCYVSHLGAQCLAQRKCLINIIKSLSWSNKSSKSLILPLCLGFIIQIFRRYPFMLFCLQVTKFKLSSVSFSKKEFTWLLYWEVLANLSSNKTGFRAFYNVLSFIVRQGRMAPGSSWLNTFHDPSQEAGKMRTSPSRFAPAKVLERASIDSAWILSNQK